jgi:RNA 2',3'-cyclic 3'-phosphodiesterase
MALLRTFIAVEIPTHIQQAIQQKTEPLRKSLGTGLVRWVQTHNVHLTLKFLGDVSPANVDILTQMLQAEADSTSVFEIQINGAGSFPSLRRPRVLFVGIQASAGLEALYRGIESACGRLGYKADANGGRSFAPHLTIGRVKPEASRIDQQRIGDALAGLKIDSLDIARVDSVHLYKSELKPSGPVYTKIFSAPLK